MQNGQFDPEQAKKDLNAVSDRLQTGTDGISYLINFFTELQNSATTDFGNSFFKDRVDHLTNVKKGMENANNGIKDIVNAIGTGQEVKKDVTDVANQKLDAANALIDQTEKDYNETFVADYKKAVSTVDQAKADANAVYDNAKADYDKVKNGIEGAKADLQKAKEDVKNRGINDLDSTKVALNSLNGQFQSGIGLIDDMIPVLESTNKVLADVNSDKNLNNGIAKLNKAKSSLQKGVEATNKGITLLNNGQKPTKDVIESINNAAKGGAAQLADVLSTYDSEIVPNFNTAIARTKEMSKNTTQILNDADKKLPDVKKVLEDASKGLTRGKDEVEKVKAELPNAEKKIKDIANKIREFESQDDLKNIIRLLKHDVEKQSDYFANPVNLKENKLYPIPNYGSAMSPFYTVLALWVGALLMVSLLTVEVHEEDAEYKSHHIYFGRFLTFLTVGLSQAFIVAVGDIFLLDTYVVDKFWFVLFSMLIAGVFVCIVYSLVSIFGNIGKSMAIVLLVLQVAGSGGTFPIQMTPKFFQALYPFLPFTYAIRIIRETVGGMIWGIVWKDLLVLCMGSCNVYYCPGLEKAN